MGPAGRKCLQVAAATYQDREYRSSQSFMIAHAQFPEVSTSWELWCRFEMRRNDATLAKGQQASV
jgi:hypothetical protein